MDEFNNELTSLGSPMPEHPSEKLNTVMNMVLQFCTAYDNSIKGKYSKIKKEQEKEPVGVAIRNNLITVFRELNKDSCLETLSDQKIKATFVNYSSSGLPGYPSFSSFQ